MKRIELVILLFLSFGCSALSQELVGRFYQNYFSGRESFYSPVYTVATPAHKDGAVMILVHGETVIDRIYIVVDKMDFKAFVNAFESSRLQYLSKEKIDDNYFPPVSIMWRDRKRHIWVESFGYLMNPFVFYEGKRSYLAFSGNASCNFFPEQQSGKYFLFLEGPSEIKGLMDILHSEKIKNMISHAKMTLRPFE